MTTALTRIVTTVRRRWRRLGAILAATTLVIYGIVYGVVSAATSSTGLAVSLPGGESLAYREIQPGATDAPRVILVHGAPADADSWTRLIRAEAEGFADAEVLAVDRLGYGNSSTPLQTSLAAHAASLEPLLTPGAVLVGHSYGGPVVLRAAAEYGDRLGGIVLVAGACDPYMHDAVWFRRLVDSAGVLIPRPWHNANAELLALTDENLAMVGTLDRVTCPVVIVHGSWDPVCPHDGTVGYLRGALTNAAEVRVVSIRRAGHNLHLSHTGVVGEAIRTLLCDNRPESVDSAP